MSIQTLVNVVSAFNDRLSKVEDTLDVLVQRTEQILEYVGEPKGELSFRTRHRPTPHELKRLFHAEVTMEEECAEMGATFSYAMYLGLVPENGEKIRELLAPAQLKHLVGALECYRKLNEITGDMAKTREEAEKAFERKKMDIQRSIELNILKGSNNVVDQLHEAQRKLTVQEDRIDVAIGQLGKALRASEDATAKAKNVTVSNSRVKRNRNGRGNQ